MPITQPRFRYLAPTSFLRMGRTVAITERAVALSTAATALAYSAYGREVVSCSITQPGMLSHVELAAPPDNPEIAGIAILAGDAAVRLLCASSFEGRWHQATFTVVGRLARGDYVVVDAWRAAAEKFVLVYQSAITKVAGALLRYGTLAGNEVLEAAHLPDATPTPHASEAEDEAQVRGWQAASLHETYRLGAKGAAIQ